MKSRGAFQGVVTIVRFNWPFYVAAAAGIATALAAAVVFPPALAVAAGALYLTLGSLVVSHLIYDRSDLYRWKWLTRALDGADTRRMIFCHSGFDEASPALATLCPDAEWTVLDHYDPAFMT